MRICVLYRLASNSGAPGGNYFILLMLTDGDNGDIADTRESIVNVSMQRSITPPLTMLHTTTIFPAMTRTLAPVPPFFSSNRHHRSNGDCLEGKRENYQVCSVQYYVQQLYTVNCIHTWTDITVLWIGFCLTGPISLCLDSFLCMYYFVSDCILHACVVL